MLIELVDRVDSVFISLIVSLSIAAIALEVRSIWIYWNRGCYATAKAVRLLRSNLRSNPENHAIPLEQLDDRVVRWLLEHLDGDIDESDRPCFRPRRRGHRFVLLSYPTILWRGVPRSPVAFAPTLLTALGVLGTFTGIYLGLQQVSLEAIAETETLLATSTQLLAGMKVAFFTSLCGLGSASGFVVFLAIGDRVRMGCRNRVRSRLDTVAFLDSPARILSRLASETSGNSGVDTRIVEELQQIRQLQERQLAALRGTQELQTVPLQIVERLENQFKRELIEPIAQQLQRSGELTERTQTAISQFGERLETSVSQFGESINAVGETQREAMAGLQEFSNQLDRALENFQTQTQTALQDSMEIQRSLLDDVQQRTQNLLDRSQTAFSSQAELLNAVGDETVKTMEAARYQLTASLENIDETIQGTRQTVEEELQRFRLDYQYALDGFFSQQNELLKETLVKQRQNLEEIGELFATTISEEMGQLGNGDR
ncbi:hypothetical protein [Baaleninema sp.]|uniref:hypothetical protein n=1 Tax=Baaleninema sp. TaxID=3101197 RepID=UPI003D0870D9